MIRAAIKLYCLPGCRGPQSGAPGGHRHGQARALTIVRARGYRRVATHTGGAVGVVCSLGGLWPRWKGALSWCPSAQGRPEVHRDEMAATHPGTRNGGGPRGARRRRRAPTSHSATLSTCKHHPTHSSTPSSHQPPPSAFPPWRRPRAFCISASLATGRLDGAETAAAPPTHYAAAHGLTPSSLSAKLHTGVPTCRPPILLSRGPCCSGLGLVSASLALTTRELSHIHRRLWDVHGPLAAAAGSAGQ